MKRMALVPLGALALAGASYAVAQNVEGLDIQAVLARGKAGEGDAQALADEVLRRSEALREEAKATAEAGQRNMTASLPRLGGGPAGLVDFDALVKTAADAGADHGRAPQLIVFASLAMPPQSLKALIRDTATREGLGFGVGLGGLDPKDLVGFAPLLRSLTEALRRVDPVRGEGGGSTQPSRAAARRRRGDQDGR